MKRILFLPCLMAPLFLLMAVSGDGRREDNRPSFQGQYASDDRSVHQWKAYALEKKSGKILWEKTAYEGVPREKRQIKASYANSTPATDGRYVITCFGSQGLYAFDMKGRLIWKKDLGVLNADAYDAPDYEWGTASSPIIYHDLVIVQCDTQNEFFLLAADIKIYLPSEDGGIFVVKAGPNFELLATNPMGELLMATPAISSGMMFVRTQHHLFAIGR